MIRPVPGISSVARRSRPAGTGVKRSVSGLAGRPGADFGLCFPYFIGKLPGVERIFEYNRGMHLGDSTATMREPRSRLDEALDQFDSALTDLIGTFENGET